ncbi:metallophosphoesterase family protein [Nafulsella turpanensis]|uniref:metallophosphoesterase family protein n=1 Tax=Nafulsella turpanensis TaxID=1265690 RepID=UPI00034948DC|nr:metallophosphoesterase [Nafulsella turpanensis]
MKNTQSTRIAAVGDIHVKEGDEGKWAPYFRILCEEADVLLLCGDLTDTGKPEEAVVLLEELQHCDVPVIGVLGNHDFQSGMEKEVSAILKKALKLLDGDSVVVEGVGFAGVKGFSGGFGRYKMPAYGEEMNKVYVQEVLREAEKLDGALEELNRQDGGLKKVAVLHYAPVEETLVGEPIQIYSYLGSSYLADPLDKHRVKVAFHGHAHAGALKGNTSGGIEVFNVSVPVLRANGFKVPFYFFEV